MHAFVAICNDFERGRSNSTGMVSTQPRRPFADHAASLIANGYSPVPIMPGQKRPALTAWQRACGSPLAPDEVARFERSPVAYGVGVAMGFNGLVALDVDADHPDVLAALRSLVKGGELPCPIVAKSGAKGFTGFYRGQGISSTSTRSADGGNLVDLLGAGRQSVIPPTMHPNGQPYRWTTRATLLDVPATDLPLLSPSAWAAVVEALRPWSKAPAPLPPPLPRTSNRQRGLDRLIEPLRFIPSDDRDTWIKVGMPRTGSDTHPAPVI